MSCLYTLTMTSTMAPTAAAPNSSAPYWLTLPDCTAAAPMPLPPGHDAGAVDGAVDDALVDVAVEPAADALPAGRRR